MILFRSVDSRFPFLWESADQPPGRWQGEGEGPTHYLADTPDGAWAEFLRHEGITEPQDVVEIRRGMWTVEAPDEILARPSLSDRTLTGGLESYPACQREARRLRAEGARGLLATSAALKRGSAGGWRIEEGMKRATPRDGNVVALFGGRADLKGWLAAENGHPQPSLLTAVRYL